MTSQATSYCRRALRLGVLLIGVCLTLADANAQNSTTGTVQGQVLNSASGNFLNNARVRVEGTNIETYTNATGQYWLNNVPAGEATIVATFVGFAEQRKSVEVTSGAVSDFDFELSPKVRSEGEDSVVELDPFTVEDRIITGQAIALTEQKNAANIKNVIALDEFVDMADGNVGEFLKFIPGVDIEYNPFTPTGAYIRGMPASGTIIQFDGVSVAAPAVAGNRTFDLNTAANANIDRIEVSKVPTPDMPANAVGGSINVISKSGFIRKTPLFSYNVYMTYAARPDEFKRNFKLSKVAGADSGADSRPLDLAYELSYLLPIKNKVAFSFAYTYAPRYQEAEYHDPNWALSATNQPLASSQYLAEFTSKALVTAAKVGFDWKIGKHSTLQLNYTDNSRDSLRRYDRVRWITSASGRTGDADSVRGRGAAQIYPDWLEFIRDVDIFSATYKYDGPIWKADATFSISNARFGQQSDENGHFYRLLGQTSNNDYSITGLSGINDGKIPDITATVAGTSTPINIFDGDVYPISRADILRANFTNKLTTAGVNVSREFDLKIPTTIKVGLYQEESDRDATGYLRMYNFRPNGSSSAAARLAGNFDLVNEAYADQMFFTTASGQRIHTRHLSNQKLYDLYLQNPSWFVLDDDAAYIDEVNKSQQITETVTAGYIRVDNKFLNNRLKVTSGVRYEHTEDKGSGPLNDISATYQRNPDGSFVTDSNGELVPITTNPLARAQLQYTARGASKSTTYDGFYPSVNAGYSLNDYLILRVGYAKTIGRPDLTNIIPTTTVSDPESVDAGSGALGVIRAVDGELDPWTANNYDLTLEAYDYKGVTASVAVFKKDVKNFFTTRDEEATLEQLQEVGLPADYLGSYLVRRTVNSGSADIQGLELSYRQQLKFLPGWASRFQVFGNYTHQNITGPNAEDFLRVAENMARAGISFVHPKLVAKLNISYEDEIKVGTASGGAYTYLGESTRLDFSFQYRFYKNLSFHFNARNITAEPQKRNVVNFNLINPDYSQPRSWRHMATNYSFGIKGTF